MPLKACSVDGKPGYKWGDRGHCYSYTEGDESSRKKAKRKAILQGVAIEGPGIKVDEADALKERREILQTFAVKRADIRAETFDGRDHLVVPVIALVEGVLNGELVLGDEFGFAIEAWNGRPATLRHPKRDGESVSANTPDMLEAIRIGTLFNAKMKSDNTFLVEAWLDVQKMESMGGEALDLLQRIRKGETIEVSTGYFAWSEETTGEFNGKSYSGIQHYFKPDHLAFLVDEVGACSVYDGCGAPRIAERSNAVEVKKRTFFHFQANEEMSFDQIEGAIRIALRDSTTNKDFWLMDVYPNFFIYEEYTVPTEMSMVPTPIGKSRMFKRTYTVDKTNKQVTLGEAKEVIRKVVYEEVGPGMKTQETQEPKEEPKEVPPAEGAPQQKPAENSVPTITSKIVAFFKGLAGDLGLEVTEKTSEPPSQIPVPIVNTSPTKDGAPAPESAGQKPKEEVVDMAKKDVIDQLIAHEATQFTEEDRPFLDGLTECQLSKLAPVQKQQEKPAQEPPAHTLPPTPTVELPANVKALADLMEKNPNLLTNMQNAASSFAQRKTTLVEKLAANKRVGLSKAALEKLEVEDLENLFRTHSLSADYSGIGAPGIEENEEIPAPPAVLLANDDKKDEKKPS